MAKLNFSKQFLPKYTGPFEFLDIDLHSDIEVFIDPFLIANNRKDPFVKRVSNQLIHFFATLNRTYIVSNDRKNGLPFLSNLHEPNEYYLGYSDSNKGKAIAGEKAEHIFDALRRNRFTRAGMGITNEAHNVLLLVSGIGQDNMSDTIANVCRNLFAEFTTQICIKYSIATIATQIQYYDSKTQTWVFQHADLPHYSGKKIILIPANIGSGKRAYTTHYNRFIAANYIASDLLNGRGKRILRTNPKMIRSLKNGDKLAVVKEIYKTYKKPKDDLIDFVLEFNGSLDEFLSYVKEHYPAVDLSDFE